MEHLYYAGNKVTSVVQLLSFSRQGVNNAMSTNAWPKITTVTIIILGADDVVDDDDHGDYLYFDNNLICASLTFFLKVSGSILCTLLRASVMSISLKALIFSLFRAPE